MKIRNSLSCRPKVTDSTTKEDYIEIPGLFSPQMNVFSAFTPTAGFGGWTGAFVNDNEDITPVYTDSYMNWLPPLIYEAMNITVWMNPNYHSMQIIDFYDAEGVPFTPQQSYIQTSDQSIVCTMGNASFDVDFTFIDGIQVQAGYSVTDFQPFWTPQMSGYTLSYLDKDDKVLDAEHFREMHSYMGIFTAFTSLLNGNVTTTLSNAMNATMDLDLLHFDGNAVIAASSSESIQFGLSACPEYAHGQVG